MEYSWTLDIFTTWDEVDDPDFLDRWLGWYDKAPLSHVFYHPVILKTWTDCYRKYQRIEPLYCVARTDDVEIFLPLVLWHRNWKNAFLRVVIPAGYSDYDYHDPIVVGPSTESLMNSFWGLIREEVFDGGFAAYDKIDLTGMHISGSESGWDREESCPFIDIGEYDDFRHYFDSLGKSLRKDIRRKRRMLGASGVLDFHVYGKQELENALKVFPAFLDVHTRKWPYAFKTPGFHEKLLSNGLPAGLVHFSEIRVDNDPISWEIGFRDGRKAYSYMPAYREEYAGYSPGKLHLASLIEDCFKSGVKIFDFMRGSEEYKGEWTDSEIFVYSFQQFADGLKSRVKLIADQTARGIKEQLGSLTFIVLSTGLLKKLWLLLRNQAVFYTDFYEIFMEVTGYSVVG